MNVHRDEVEVNIHQCFVLVNIHQCSLSLGTERVKGDSFLTPSVPRGFPLTSKISGVRQSKNYKYVLGTERVNIEV